MSCPPFTYTTNIRLVYRANICQVVDSIYSLLCYTR